MSFIELRDELAALDAFNPDEPRDADGKWTGGASEIEDKLANDEEITEMPVSYAREGGAGYLTPTGRMYDIGGSSHSMTNKRLGIGELSDVLGEGFGRIYMEPGGMLGVEMDKPLTFEQANYLIEAADIGNFEKLVVEGAAKNCEIEPPGGLTSKDVRRALNESGHGKRSHAADDFNPNEPRDSSGKWTAGGGSARKTKTEWTSVNWHGVKDIEVAKNPDLDDIYDISKGDETSAVRLLRDDKGNVFAWPASDAIHDQVAEGIDFELGPSNGSTNTRIVWKRDGKFVSHQSMDGWLRDGTIKQIGPNEGAAPSSTPHEIRGPGQTWTEDQLKRFSDETNYYSKKLGYDPDKVYVSTDSYRFTLNGRERVAAGAAYTKGGSNRVDQSNGHRYEKGDIVMYANGFQRRVVDPAVLAHEVEHQKFQFFLDSCESQRLGALKEMREESAKVNPGYDPKVENFPLGEISNKYLDYSGALKPEFKDRWPLYWMSSNLIDARRRVLEKTDGVTDYSREWWQQNKVSGTGTESAMHETLAEMAYHHQMMGGEPRFVSPEEEPDGSRTHSSTGGAKPWRELYAAVDEVWKQFHKPKA